MNTSQKIYVAGHNGMVGRSICNHLKSNGYDNIVGISSKSLDLRDFKAVEEYIQIEQPNIIIDAAAVVGGIIANQSYPYQFLMDNMLIQNNLIKAAHENNVNKFIFLGSSCIYPKLASQPISEDSLLTGPLEPTNEWYAIAKISGVKACEAIRKQFQKDYVSLMPSNLYGPYDNFDLETSHVMPALIRKFHEAKLDNHSPVTLWGTGSPKREFLHVSDLANAVLHAVENVLPESLYNIGLNDDISIKELASIVQKTTGHKGEIIWDTSKPDGTPRKLLNTQKINQLGWKPKIELTSGIQNTYEWYLNNVESIRKVTIA
ncbi:MAG: GDP-L-fucose synthase family protein [bacterium]